MGLLRTLLLESDREGVESEEDEVLLGRGVFARIVSMSGLSGRLGGILGVVELFPAADIDTVRVDLTELLLHGSV